MDIQQDLSLFTPEPNPHETRDRFFKLVIGTAAGFIAAKVAENLYDGLMTKYRANRL